MHKHERVTAGSVLVHQGYQLHDVFVKVNLISGIEDKYPKILYRIDNSYLFELKHFMPSILHLSSLVSKPVLFSIICKILEQLDTT